MVAIASGMAALVALGSVAALRAPRAASSPAVVTSSTMTARPRRDPVKARQLLEEAVEWQANNDTAAARDLLEKVILLDPDNAEAHFRLGGLFLASQPDRACHEYRLSKKLDPSTYADDVDSILKNR